MNVSRMLDDVRKVFPVTSLSFELSDPGRHAATCLHWEVKHLGKVYNLRQICAPVGCGYPSSYWDELAFGAVRTLVSNIMKA